MPTALSLLLTRALSSVAAPPDHPPPAAAHPRAAAAAAAAPAASAYTSHAAARKIVRRLQLANPDKFKARAWGDAADSLHPSVPPAPDAHYADAGCVSAPTWVSIHRTVPTACWSGPTVAV